MESAWPAHHGEMGRRIREFDWEATPLGVIESWPSWLGFAVDLMLASGLPTAIHVGPEAITLYNQAASQYLGEKHPAALGWPLFEIHADLRARWEATLMSVLAGNTLTTTEPRSWFDPDVNAPIRNFTVSAAPLRDDAGAVTAAWVVFVDTSEERLRIALAVEERQKLLIGELQHRTRNLLAIVQTLVDRTLRSTTDLAHVRVELTGRLQALSRVQSLLTNKSDSDPVPLEQILMNELAAHGVEPSNAQRVLIRGPSDVALPAGKVQVMMMAVHELATNALKHGALKEANARLYIEWWRMRAADGSDWIHLTWHEQGVAIADPAAGTSRHGLGRDLIERALPFQLGGRSSFVLTEDGLLCTIEFPLSI